MLAARHMTASRRSNEVTDAPKVPAPKQPEAPAPKIPDHGGENVTTRDTSPSTERPGHEIETPKR